MHIKEKRMRGKQLCCHNLAQCRRLQNLGNRLRLPSLGNIITTIRIA